MTEDHDKHGRFLVLYVKHEQALRGFVRSLVPTLEDAREVMQETAAILWRKFDESVDFRPWAFGVARFEALAFIRDRARDRHVFGDEVLALLEEEALEEAKLSEHEEKALEQCLEKLTPPQRTLIETAYAPGVRIDELASASGRTAMAVYKSLHRLRMTLADCVRLTLREKEETA